MTHVAFSQGGLTNRPHYGWEEGSIFLLHTVQVASFSDQELMNLRLVCKKWKVAIDSECIYSSRIKKKSLDDYQQFPLENSTQAHQKQREVQPPSLEDLIVR